MLTKSAAEYYVWSAKGKPVEVRLSLTMAQFMVRWIRDHGALDPELFGMLLGHTSRGWYRSIVHIDDFEPFDPSSLRGSPRPPHGSELKVVGLYRRRTGEQLVLDQLDSSLIQTSFNNPGMVYLLMAPSAGAPDRAAFFIQEDGEVHGYANYGEFPFDPEFLRRPSADSARAGSRRWMPVAGLIASLLALGGWFFWLRQDTPASTPPPAAIQVPAVQKPAAVEQSAPAPEKPAVASPKPARKKAEKSRKKTTKRKRRRQQE